ncbi:MAG TPA: GntR family transcriptional regulator [Solirubrobacterales bacterium]|jgi:DNA-binding GntR family transcriptional regulator|nr:GntR family transcriptional regulator [Solirubrobacterales bacterium]
MPTTRAGAVAAELRRQIQDGELAPGARLRQVETAEQMGVSTTPVREAFAALAREGLVRQDPHRGTVVFLPSLDELNENYEIREALEPLATKFAAERITEEELAELDDLVAEMHGADAEEQFSLNRTLHEKIYAASRRPRLATLIANLRDSGAAYLNLVRVDAVYTARSHDEHEAIVDALRKHNGKKAATLMAKHLKTSADVIAAAVAARADGPGDELPDAPAASAD